MKTDNVSLAQRVGGAVLGSFIGDALTLGAHWIYNPKKIATTHGRVNNYINPENNQYHKERQTGDLSHYGDQTLELMRSIDGGFDLSKFTKKWQAMWTPDYSGYVDGATKSTLESGSSDSNDLAGASRIAPLLVPFAGSGKAKDFVEAAKSQTALTHGDPAVIEAAEFFATLTHGILQGASFENALKSVLEQNWSYIDPTNAIDDARDELAEDTVEALVARGLDCHMPSAFPATLFILLKHQDSFEDALIENTMAGGDSAARGMLIGMVLGALHGVQAIPERLISGLNAAPEIQGWLGKANFPIELSAGTNKFEFQNQAGETLVARLEWPLTDQAEPKAIAVFAHCFTCTKDIAAATHVSRNLAQSGFAVLRFDFTGLGNSDGDFGNTNFSSNVQDLVSAAKAVSTEVGKPVELLIGHSLGGAAVLSATGELPDLKGVVTIGAPSDPSHVSHLFEHDKPKIESEGEAEVDLGGRKFTIKQQFLEDIQSQKILDRIAEFKGALLVMHSPTDSTVSIDHAGHIYSAAKHPKSFVSLAKADHLLLNKRDSKYAANIIAAWAGHLFED